MNRLLSRVFGGLRSRDVGWEGTLATIWQDIRYGARLMRRSPAFTSVAVVVLALGIGVNTALFSIVNTLFFAPIAVKAPNELVYLYYVNPGGQILPYLSQEAFRFFEQQSAEYGTFTAYSRTPRSLSADDETETTWGETVRVDYFERLGVKAAFGRTLGPSEADPATTEGAVVISHDLWARRFRGKPDVIGTRLRIGQLFYSIVGVMPAGFTGISDPWQPSQFWMSIEQSSEIGARSSDSGGPIVRLKPGVSTEQFKAVMRGLVLQWKEQWLKRLTSTSSAQRERWEQIVAQTQYRAYAASDVRIPRDPEAKIVPTSMLVALVTVVTLVLLIATANIAGLLLARGVARTGEVAVRRALGAAGIRLTRQFLTESVLLSGGGGLLGLAVAWNLLAIFRAATPAAFTLDVQLDWRVLLFAAAVCVGAGVLVGLAPALQARHVNVLEALGTGIVGARHTRTRLRHWIVIPQVGLSLVLLLVAGVHVRALHNVERTDPGYATDGATVFRVGRWEPRSPFPPRLPSGSTAEEQSAARIKQQEGEAATIRAFLRSILDRMRNVHAASSYALSGGLPLQSSVSDELSAVVVRDGTASAHAIQTVVSEGYFDAMGMRLLRGRAFDGRDGYGGKKVAIISEGLAKRLWPGGDAIGQPVAFDPGNSPKGPDWLEVVGIVPETDPVLGKTTDRPRIYESLVQKWRPSIWNLVVRGPADQSALIQEVRAAVVGADSFAEVTSVRTMAQMVDEILYPRRVAAAVLATAGLVGLALAAIGLYGVVSYSVAQRRRELGIRTTLGAGRRDLVRLVLREGARVTVIGGAVGFVMAMIALRLTASLTPGLPLVDMWSFVGVPAILAAVVLVACYLPARRAARVDPVEVLRST